MIEIDILGKGNTSIFVEEENNTTQNKEPSKPEKLEGFLDLGLQLVIESVKT